MNIFASLSLALLNFITCYCLCSVNYGKDDLSHDYYVWVTSEY